MAAKGQGLALLSNNLNLKPNPLILAFETLLLSQLEPLGVNTELDKTKLVQSKKASERKAVKKAYEEVFMRNDHGHDEG